MIQCAIIPVDEPLALRPRCGQDRSFIKAEPSTCISLPKSDSLNFSQCRMVAVAVVGVSSPSVVHVVLPIIRHEVMVDAVLKAFVMRSDPDGCLRCVVGTASRSLDPSLVQR